MEEEKKKDALAAMSMNYGGYVAPHVVDDGTLLTIILTVGTWRSDKNKRETNEAALTRKRKRKSSPNAENRSTSTTWTTKNCAKKPKNSGNGKNKKRGFFQ